MGRLTFRKGKGFHVGYSSEASKYGDKEQAVKDKLCDFEDAEEQGRLVMLDETRRPLVWSDESRAGILCPYCRNDLMGGFPKEDGCETDIIQCFHCGRPVDGTKEPFAHDDPNGFVNDDVE